ncbi:MAG: hypothetical protein ACP5SG_07815 [Dissulfurimicrobium sp.]|uniref:hypothetical protein n=1 Tax=Dissulfurimicrobium TaxID=1769732 RepID=UPI003C742074
MGRRGLTRPDFMAFFGGKIKGNFPVAVLDKEYMQALGAKSQTVYMSDETLAKTGLNIQTWRWVSISISLISLQGCN